MIFFGLVHWTSTSISGATYLRKRELHGRARTHVERARARTRDCSERTPFFARIMAAHTGRKIGENAPEREIWRNNVIFTPFAETNGVFKGPSEKYSYWDLGAQNFLRALRAPQDEK